MIKLKGQAREIDMHADHADVGDRQLATCNNDASAGLKNVSACVCLVILSQVIIYEIVFV